MNDFVSVKCPQCGESMYASSKKKKCKCSNCGTEIIINECVEQDVSTEKLGKQSEKGKLNSINLDNLSKTFNSTWFTFLSLIIVFPIGLYLMWKNKKFDFTKRTAISIVFGIIFIVFLISIFGKDNGVNKKVNKKTYESIKKELGIEKEAKNGFSEKDNTIYYFENYKFSIPDYYKEDDNNEFSVIENGATVAKISLVKMNDTDDTVTFSLLEKETKQGKMQESLKRKFGDIEVLEYESIKNEVIQGILYKFISTDKSSYYEQLVYGDDVANDWYYITLKENVNSHYEYIDDYTKICDSITRIKKIKMDKSSFDFLNCNYQDLIGYLKSKGFYDIETVPNYDLIFGWLSKEGDFDTVTIDNKVDFSNGDEFRENSRIIVKYHAFPSSEPVEDRTNKIIGTYIGNKGSAITLNGDTAVYYYRPADFYEDDINCKFDGDKYYLDIKGLDYKIYLDYSIDAKNPYYFKSDNINWETEEFNKINSEGKVYEKKEYDRMLTSSDVIVRRKCQELVEELKEDGFNNIKVIPNYDVYFGVISKVGDVEQFTINGNTKFDSYLDFDKEADIQIKYHENYDKDPKYIAKKESKEKESSISSVIGWKQIDGEWYYFNNNGTMQKSKFIDEYYVGEDGKMIKNTTKKISGKMYRFDDEGKGQRIEDLELVGGIHGCSTHSDYFVTYITGKVKNNTDKNYKYIQITFDLYDSSGAKVGTAVDNISDIEAGGVWKFNAMALEEFSKYKLSKITGW